MEGVSSESQELLNNLSELDRTEVLTYLHCVLSLGGKAEPSGNIREDVKRIINPQGPDAEILYETLATANENLEEPQRKALWYLITASLSESD